ncbi:hypothetical protein [Arhodomonas sp. AD133]|uniref:hypothetical protein n=1 Tax=Arhodomonas sp. AD133 TaxID=3415009 RepID=UPI003EBBC17F
MVWRVKIVLYVALLAALAASAYYAQGGIAALTGARQHAALASARLHALKQQLATLDQRQAHERDVRVVLDRAARLGLDVPDRWHERRVLHRSDTLTRDRVIATLDEALGGPGTAFVPTAFQVSVLAPRFGLFRSPAEDDPGVRFQLEGSLHFPIEDETP